MAMGERANAGMRRSIGRRASVLSYTLRCRRGGATRPFRCNSQRDLDEFLDVDLSDLQSSLDEAVVAEEYEKAAILRDAINKKKEEDPIISLERSLREAVEVENYEQAARLRDAIAEEIATRPLPMPVESSSGTRSSATTEGVRVDVQSIFVPQHSGVQGNMFAYQITIVNVAHPTTIKLISRHWEIKDAKGRERIVDGEGVVGEQPELAPGESFTYQSSCPLQTDSGSMKGHFEFYSRASQSTSWNTSFLAYVAEFELNVRAPRSFD